MKYSYHIISHMSTMLSFNFTTATTKTMAFFTLLIIKIKKDIMEI